MTRSPGNLSTLDGLAEVGEVDVVHALGGRQPGRRQEELSSPRDHLGGFKPSSYTVEVCPACETLPATGVANEESVEKIPPSAGQLRDHLQ